MKCQVISGHRGFECGKDKNLAVRTYLENRSAAISHVEVPGAIERETGGNAHAFDPLLGAAVGRDAVDSSVVAAGNVKISAAIQRQTRRVDQRGEERFHVIVRSDLVQRHWN